MRWRRHASRNALYPLPAGIIRAAFRLLPHVLPIRGSVLQFPGDKGFPLSRDCELDAGVRVQSVPEHVAKKTEEGEQEENEDDDREGKCEGVHGFRFWALWWWLYSGKSSGRAILYSVIRGWALPRFLSGSQVSSAAEYPFHLIRKVQQPGFPLCPRTASTSYSSSPSIRSGVGWRKLGPCSNVSL